jgi:hypothetical protein
MTSVAWLIAEAARVLAREGIDTSASDARRSRRRWD